MGPLSHKWPWIRKATCRRGWAHEPDPDPARRRRARRVDLLPMTPMEQLRAGRTVRRVTQLLVGLWLYGTAMAMFIRAELGLDPWDVFHYGVQQHLGWSFGTVVIVVGALVLLLWIPLRQWPGLGHGGQRLRHRHRHRRHARHPRDARRAVAAVGAPARRDRRQRHRWGDVHRQPVRPRPPGRADDRARPAHRAVDPARPHRARGHGARRRLAARRCRRASGRCSTRSSSGRPSRPSCRCSRCGSRPPARLALGVPDDSAVDSQGEGQDLVDTRPAQLATRDGERPA